LGEGRAAPVPGYELDDRNALEKHHTYDQRYYLGIRDSMANNFAGEAWKHNIFPDQCGAPILFFSCDMKVIEPRAGNNFAGPVSETPRTRVKRWLLHWAFLCFVLMGEGRGSLCLGVGLRR